MSVFSSLYFCNFQLNLCGLKFSFSHVSLFVLSVIYLILPFHFRFWLYRRCVKLLLIKTNISWYCCSIIIIVWRIYRKRMSLSTVWQQLNSRRACHQVNTHPQVDANSAVLINRVKLQLSKHLCNEKRRRSCRSYRQLQWLYPFPLKMKARYYWVLMGFLSSFKGASHFNYLYSCFLFQVPLFYSLWFW